MVNPQYEYCTWRAVYRLHSTIFYYYFFWCLAAQLIVLWVQFTPGLWPTNGEMLGRDPGRLHLTCSAQTTTVCLTVSLSTAFSWPHILPTSILQQIVRNIFYQQNNAGQRVWRKKKCITQRLQDQAGELLGRRDCHVCINRHWFFCPALAPQPFILSIVVGAPAGLEKFCYSPLRPLRPVCENRFHL